MSSGRIGMVMTYSKNKLYDTRQPPAPPPVNNPPSVNRATIVNKAPIQIRSNRFASISMNTIIHKPSGGCSSCGF